MVYYVMEIKTWNNPDVFNLQDVAHPTIDEDQYWFTFYVESIYIYILASNLLVYT
jgi:hypothetical protein